MSAQDPDPLEDQAKALVSAANILAVSTFTPVIDQYAFLKKVNPQDWDFFAAAASIQVAITNLTHSVSTARFKLLYTIIGMELCKWNRQGEGAIFDCQRFVKRTLEAKIAGGQKILPVDAMGMWVIWSLLQRTPTYEEGQASHGIGKALADPLHDWWIGVRTPPSSITPPRPPSRRPPAACRARATPP
jgi:hypothetical protein